MLLIISENQLAHWRSIDDKLYCLAKPTPDAKNFIVEALERRPRRRPSHEAFLGASTKRAETSKLYDFTIDPHNLELQSYNERFPCDQLLIVDDSTLFDYLIDSKAVELVTETSVPALLENRLNHQSSYLEHHSALVKLAFIVQKLVSSPKLTLFILLTLDTVLGSYFGPSLCELWPAAIEQAVPKARNIVEWLRAGTPLGLKLNPQVNLALAKFFTCHVSLWNVYVEVILPVLRSLTDSIANVGFVPLTLQCSLVCDIITLSTIHVYCFYGYMCKIYSFWLRSFFALLRIFRGLKWNPLRQRIDSLTDSDPILLCPIILTMVIFLFPTVFLYYAFFSVMRCCVLVANFVLGTLSHDLMLFTNDLLNSLCGEATIDIQRTYFKRINDSALIARANYTRNTGRDFMNALSKLVRVEEMVTFCKDIVAGKIVYPL